MSPDKAFAEAQVRIAEEAVRRTGALDLTDLPLRDVPRDLFDLDHLVSLRLGYGIFVVDRIQLNINKFSDLLRTMVNIRDLHVRYSDINCLSFVYNLKDLIIIDVGGNVNLEDISPLSGLPNLQQVNCSGTQVSDLSPLSGLPNLQQVDCGGTQVSDLSPLSGLPNLQQVDCFNTQVSDLSPLSGLPNLQQVDCCNTQVSDLSPLSGLPNLQKV
ncbi:leucine-rich repeat domain-containing protein [Methylobacterium aquaticum]|uniref:leucine-rich repeat domain-containing protein n=1 Tax=Methylobacterium aquaticum TaxID=270351 RepID=UPI000A800C5A|nr:leucine-rich repeat domain-containing protein [Methylobacterium aquaticum]